MKRTKYIYILAAIGIFAVARCSKGFLNEKPLNSFSEIDVFSDINLLGQYTTGTYRGLGEAFDNFVDGYDAFTEGLTDNAYANNYGGGLGYTHAATTRDNGESVTWNIWSSGYYNIRRVNVFFEKTTVPQTKPADSAALRQLTGEMRFIRAYLYAKLLKWYGGVPIITASIPLTQTDFGVARNTADEVTGFIVKQCDSAVLELLSVSNSNYQKGRASLEAAMALKARVLLYSASPLWNPSNDLAKWQAASDANQAVMNITTVPLLSDPTNYKGMFNGTNNDEIIMARYFTPINAHGGGAWGVNLWLYPNGLGGWSNVVPTQDLVDCYELTSGKLPTDPSSGYDPQNPYVNRDPRFYQSILFNGAAFLDPTLSPPTVRPMEFYRDSANPTNPVLAGRESRSSSNAPYNASHTGYNFRKYTDEGRQAGASGSEENLSPYVYFRLSEFYLNYAECRLALSDEAGAKTAINTIRARVNMPPVTESGTDLVTRYRNERRVELALEDIRFDDMRRWKAGPQALGHSALGVDVYKGVSSTQYVYGYVADSLRKWDDKMYLLPIPYSDILASQNKLTQNPGY